MVVLQVVDGDDAGLIATLRGEGLPDPGAGRYFIADEHGGLAGYVGLEGEGRDLLLRSLVVLPELKGQGLGSRILSAAEAVASDLGAERLHLLTTTAEPFFTRNGYQAADRKTASAAIRQTREFAELCPASAVYMTKDFMTFPRLRSLPDPDHLPALDPAYLSADPARGLGPHERPPRILLLYGSLRDRSYSRLCVEEAARLLQRMGCETRIFDPSDLPLPGSPGDDDHPAVGELREHAFWSEGMVWCSPERHGQVSGVMKLQIDHLPLSLGGMRPTQGRTLAVMQVSGGSQSFNAVNTLRLLGRWMRMVTIPNQSSVAKAFQEFDDSGRMRMSAYYERIVDVMEELVRFTVLLRPHAAQLVDRYSERKAARTPIDTANDLSSIAVAAAPTARREN